MSEQIEQIAQIRSQAEQAIAAARNSQDLEEARVAYLGRKAELPNLLRTVAELPAEQRAAAADLQLDAGPGVSAGLRRHPYAPVSPDGGTGGRYRRHACRPPGDAVGLGPGHLRRGTPGAHASSLLPVHGAFGGSRRFLFQ